MNSEANIGIIVESVVNETSRLCQCQLTAEQIQDAMLTCSNDSNAVTFRASLVGSEANTSTAILDKIAEWVMNPSSCLEFTHALCCLSCLQLADKAIAEEKLAAAKPALAEAEAALQVRKI